MIKSYSKLKNIAGQVLTYNSKDFLWLNEKLDLERTATESGKPFLKKSDKKIKKVNKIIVKKPHVNKKNTTEKLKFSSNKILGQEWTRNGLRKPIRKKSDPKRKKTINEIAACEQKTTSEKANFCSNTVLSLYFKLERKNLMPRNHSLFRSISCFGVTKITTPIWLQKSWNCVNRS